MNPLTLTLSPPGGERETNSKCPNYPKIRSPAFTIRVVGIYPGQLPPRASFRLIEKTRQPFGCRVVLKINRLPGKVVGTLI
jgi:hypothetical protein